MQIKTWAIIIPKESSDDPALYFNDVRGSWVNKFQGGCSFFDEESAVKRLNDIDIMGARVVEGLIK